MPTRTASHSPIDPLVRIADSALEGGEPRIAADAHAELALLALRRGAWDEAEEHAARAAAIVADAGLSGRVPAAVAAAALVPAARGELSTALTRVEEAMGIEAVHRSLLSESVCLHVRLMVLIGMNDWHELERVVEDADGTAAMRYFERSEWYGLRLLAAWHLNQVTRCDALLATWRSETDPFGDPYFSAYESLLLDRDGRHSEALVSVRRAADTIGPDDDPLGRTWVRLVAGSTLARRGDSPMEGLGLYREARDELDRLGARLFVARCDSIIATMTDRLAQHPDRNPLSTLSPHQRRVATLVADGHTNREIGQILGVSTKTVDFHVGNILSRLRLQGRRDVRDLLHQSHR
jgi:DNA-binding CsgD family transcriptional regulator